MDNKMTPDFFSTLPWRISSQKWLDCFYHITGKDGDRELKILSLNDGHHPIKEHRDRIRNNAEAIVSAVNYTYGQGIRPEAVPELRRTLQNMCEYFEWLIKDPYFPSYREAKEALEKAKL